jgi:hypothetical protein
MKDEEQDYKKVRLIYKNLDPANTQKLRNWILSQKNANRKEIAS